MSREIVTTFEEEIKALKNSTIGTRTLHPRDADWVRVLKSLYNNEIITISGDMQITYHLNKEPKELWYHNLVCPEIIEQIKSRCNIIH
ncbi:MAG: hypothetical protein R3Y29_01755 [bacterium]